MSRGLGRVQRDLVVALWNGQASTAGLAGMVVVAPVIERWHRVAIRRSLRSLERRGLVTSWPGPGGAPWWNLTEDGLFLAEEIVVAWGR